MFPGEAAARAEPGPGLTKQSCPETSRGGGEWGAKCLRARTPGPRGAPPGGVRTELGQRLLAGGLTTVQSLKARGGEAPPPKVFKERPRACLWGHLVERMSDRGGWGRDVGSEPSPLSL